MRPGTRRREAVGAGACALMPISPITAPEEAPPAAPRALRLPLDPLLTLAVAGLATCSLVTLRAATGGLVPGNPTYYVERQGIYLLVGAVLMLVLSRIDYARLRHFKNAIYALLQRQTDCPTRERLYASYEGIGLTFVAPRP